jgi:hypothetical protein
MTYVRSSHATHQWHAEVSLQNVGGTVSLAMIPVLLGGLGIETLSLLEVYDVPDGVEIVGLDVLVLEIECMLPDIDSNDRNVCYQSVITRSMPQ